MLRISCFLLAIIVTTQSSAVAADSNTPSLTPLADAAKTAAGAAPPFPPPVWTVDRLERRPATLAPLYVSFAAVQVTDILSTRKAIANDATEANPLMRTGTIGQIAIKAAATTATIYVVERAWKQNRVGAVVTMLAINTLSAAVVVRNTRNAHP